MNEITVKQNQGFLVVNNLAEAVKVSEIIANSGMCPAAYAKKPGDVLVAMQMGAELGLKPMQALQNIAVIQGRPSLWGDGMLAVCMQDSAFEDIQESFDEKTYTATCVVKRRNMSPITQAYSKADAERAGLWNKQGPWKYYPKRMLQMRARGFALRDAFPDILRGFISTEEAQDIPTQKLDKYEGGVTLENDKAALVSREQLEYLIPLMAEVGRTEDALKAYLNINDLTEMSEAQYLEIVKILEKKKQERHQAQNLDINAILVEDKAAEA